MFHRTDESSLLSNGRFVKLWAGQGISFLGDAVSLVALVILAVEISGSAQAVGGLLIARLLPMLAGPAAGVLANRLDRKAVLVGSDLVRAGLIFAVVFVENIPVLYVLAFFLGAARAIFRRPGSQGFPADTGHRDRGLPHGRRPAVPLPRTGTCGASGDLSAAGLQEDR